MSEIEDFLDRIDLKRDEFIEAKALLEQGNQKEAASAILNHFRTRKEPLYLFSKDEAGSCLDPLVLKEAEDTLNKYIYGHQFGNMIDWHFNPTENTSRDNEWSWSLYRTIYWQPLVRAYAQTKDEKYVREFVAQMRSFALAWPVEPFMEDSTFETKFKFPGHAWRTIETGMRIYTNWLACFEVFRSSSAFDDESLMIFLDLIHDHAEFLMTHYSNHNRSSNWLSMECSALFQCGIFFPEFSKATSWFKTGYQRVMHEVLYCFDNDGVHMERTPIYHMVASIAFLQAYRMCVLNTIEVAPYMLSILERTAEYVMTLVKPDLSTPMFGDADRDDLTTSRSDTSLYEGMNLSFDPEDLNELRSYFKIMHTLTGRKDFLYVATCRKEGEAPAILAKRFDAGIYLMRSGYGADDSYALLHGVWLERGERSTHSHNDQGHLELMVKGEDILIDCGRYIYNSSCWKDWRAYFTGVASHNTIAVDNHIMGTVSGVERVRGVRTLVNKFEKKDDFWIMDISHNGYAFMEDSLFHRRRFVRLPNDIYILEDELTGPGKENHDIRLYFNFAPGTLQQESRTGYRYTTQKGTEHGFSVFCSDPDSLNRQLEGSEDPKGGWVSYGYPNRQPTPQLCICSHKTAPLRFVTIIAPYAVQGEVELSSVQAHVRIAGYSVSFGQEIAIGKDK
ncbi:Heparinase II/III-like protein [Sphaerochaeta pleomorpha str. Grapes]|uniref:Heparinase II/III-like protein n=1 Tax=Sphaerochaeta pleomorpha (strain ATCC BAA-1885 / DSM 22778 / Grapes) TaxID=158190 RepID=G8QXM9_SPHPG|nr:alginate lyase family protein [Sphaerochaeta pleomorpha]AEV29592.1 Heparinase II/III-like protein [Sphaerochaeta pleomorpha str. Grapes]